MKAVLLKYNLTNFINRLKVTIIFEADTSSFNERNLKIYELLYSNYRGPQKRYFYLFIEYLSIY